MKEIWKDIRGYEGLYQISNLGRVKKLRYEYVDTYKSGRHRVFPEHLVAINLCKNGYYMVDLRKHNEKRKRVYVHRLIAEAFIPNPNNLPCINHKDENRQNNSINNLEWCTYRYNVIYGNSRRKSVATRRKNNSYIVSDDCRDKIRNKLKGKKKTNVHCKHISEGRKKYFQNKKYCEVENDN